jgi:hypothetical protein
MKRLLVLLIVLVSVAASAQNTLVSGTVTDSDGTAWANGAMQFYLINPSPQINPTCGGVLMTTAQKSFTLPTDGSGSITNQPVCSTASIVPATTQWLITICSNTSAPCQSLTPMRITGATFSLTATITAQIQAIRLAASATTRAYADVEILTPVPQGGTYYNVTTGTTRQWNGIAWTNSGGSGGGIQWQRQGVIIVSQGNDPSPQSQEPSAIWDSTPEVLTGYSEVVKMSWTDGWWYTGGGGTGIGLCFGESPDGLASPTRISAGCPLTSTLNHARSYMLPTRQSGNIVVLATNINTGVGDIFTGTTMAGLTATTTNVISCGGNGGELSNTLGNWAIVNTTGNTWVMLYDCFTNNGNYADYRAVSTTGYAGPYTKTSTNPVLLDTAASPGVASCIDGGGPWLYYDGTKMWVAIHCGPQGPVPTPYIYIGSSTDNGLTWKFGSGPNLTAQTTDEGIGLTGGQIADAYILPDFSGVNGGGNRTTLYYGAYTNGCTNQAICTAPSHIKVATINAPLATVLASGSTDGSVYRPGLSAYVTPPANPLSFGQVGQWSIAGGNLYVYNPNGTLSAWNQYNPTAWTGNLQDFATFVGTAATPISSYATGTGKTFALYAADGTSPQSIPLLTGTNQAILAAGTTVTYGDVLDSLTPATANYTASGVFTYVTASTNALAAIFARATSGAATYYVWQCTVGVSNTACAVFRVVTGTATQIGVNYILPVWPLGTSHIISLLVNGTTITASVDGIAGINITDPTGISTAGQAGFRITGGSSMEITNFTVQ